MEQSKPHYLLLDGLRGVAALMVMCYHVFEGFCTSPIDQHFNHGYLAVDFFFILSGFVIGYAYDDRWKRPNAPLTTRQFFRRRLIRLHPMVIVGALLGVLTFCIQGCVQWDGTHISMGQIIVALVMGMLLLPLWPGAYGEVRGNGELFPLNGPSWSLFFEYIGNILYAVLLRKLSTRHLKWVVILLGAALMGFAMLNGSGYGHLGVGWTMADNNLWGGLLRMSFSYSAGLLLSRMYHSHSNRIPKFHFPCSPFWVCSAMLFVLFCIPHIGGGKTLWLNGLYDSFCVLVCFPFIVWIGATGQTKKTGGTSRLIPSDKFLTLLGDISYPIYMVHYPFMYLFYAWVWNNGLTFSQAWPRALLVIAGSIVIAWIFMRYYDKPVRRALQRVRPSHDQAE